MIDAILYISQKKDGKHSWSRELGRTPSFDWNPEFPVLCDKINKSNRLQVRELEKNKSKECPSRFISASSGYLAAFAYDEGPLFGAPPLSLENSKDFVSIVTVLG